MSSTSPKDTVGTEDTNDASMVGLAPRPSRRRNALLLIAGIATLSAAAIAPPMVQPSLDISSGTWTALGQHRHVLTTTELHTSTWPSVGIHSVDDVPGAVASEAWLIDGVGHQQSSQATHAAADFDSAIDYVRATMPQLNMSSDALPRRLSRGHSAMLVVLWTITDCDALTQGTRAHAELSTAHIELRTIFRTSSRHALPEIASPGYSPETLDSSNTCT